jgi:hypothetical protein
VNKWWQVYLVPYILPLGTGRHHWRGDCNLPRKNIDVMGTGRQTTITEFIVVNVGNAQFIFVRSIAWA